MYDRISLAELLRRVGYSHVKLPLADFRHKFVMSEMGLWTSRELADYLCYTESTVARMVTDMPHKLPPRVACLGKPRWHPDVVEQWALEQSSEINSRVGRPRAIK